MTVTSEDAILCSKRFFESTHDAVTPVLLVAIGSASESVESGADQLELIQAEPTRID